MRRVVLGALLVAACARKAAPRDEAPPPPPAPAITVPPVAQAGLAPPAPELDAGSSPYEQARAYASGGQYWLGRLVLEPKALGVDGTRAEVELLAQICDHQGDVACREACAQRLAKKDAPPAPTARKGRR